MDTTVTESPVMGQELGKNSEKNSFKEDKNLIF